MLVLVIYCSSAFSYLKDVLIKCKLLKCYSYRYSDAEVHITLLSEIHV